MKLKHLDLFSGYGGFTIACEKNGIETIGFSEIDKYANSVLKYRCPHIKNYGDINDIDIDALPDFDLLTFGSPCQDLSIAKKDREGLEGKRSGLFYKAVEILRKKKPRYFIMENVYSMGKENRDKISGILGVEPVMINASLVSAQNRKRLFWANFPITQPEDRGILLRDILEDGIPEKEKSNTIRTSGRGSGLKNKHNWDEIKLKSYCLPATYYKENIKSLVKRKKDGLTIRIGQLNKGGQGDRIYSIEGKSVNLSANGGGRGAKTGLCAVKDYVRKLTPVECERLMTLPDNFTQYGINEKGEKVKISNSQRYKLCGNGVVVEVVDGIIKDLLSGVKGLSRERRKIQNLTTNN
jgi:DNA (cytosine-5)-methyltransferase 3A